MTSSTYRVIQRVTWIGLLANLLLTGFKFAGGIFGHSHAVFADALHSLSDMATDVIVLVGSRYWEQPADESHPYGHRRIETLVTILIGFSLALVGFRLFWDVTVDIGNPPDQPPSALAVWATLASIFVKETLYHWTRKHGKAVDSPALIANAWHHRSDAVSSIPVLLAVWTAMYFPNIVIVDDLGALIVSLFILHAAWTIFWPGILEMVDAGAPPHIRNKLVDLAFQIDGVLEVHDIRTRFVGSKIQADIHIVVNDNITVRQGHDIAAAVMDTVLKNGPGVVDVLVHVDPDDDSKLNRITREED